MRERLKALEEAMLHLEGAHYALHDIVALMLAKTPADDVETMAVTLADQVSVHADRIGEIRLAGYTEEIKSVADEVRHSQSVARGLFHRLTRSR
jgi:hypothetical protein